MSSAARIEELQKKFDENPRRYFAPLANECRKAGDLDAAIAICRAHLPQQPGHMSGHIVYGQALFESGDLGEARTVFETALGLDPENLIALRHMGDIAAREGDTAAARRWYTRVLETDPRNEEIQSLVAGLGHAEAPALVAFDRDEELPAGEAPLDDILGAAPFDDEDAPRVRGGLPTLVDPALLAAAADAVPDADFASTSDGAASEPELVDLSAGFGVGPLITTEAEAATGADISRDELLEPTALEFDAPVSPAGMLEGLEATTFEAPEGAETSGYERVGDEALLDSLDSPTPQLEGLESAEFDASGYGGSGLETIAAPAFEFEPADAGPMQDPPQDPVPEPLSDEAFVTETMAELYLRQGYRDEALGVYRKLVNQSPDDGALRSRMERLESELAGDDGYGSPREDFAGGDEGEIPGLPQAMEPALVAAAADAVETPTAPSSPSGPTIREFLVALAAGVVTAAPEPDGEIPDVVNLGEFDVLTPDATGVALELEQESPTEATAAFEPEALEPEWDEPSAAPPDAAPAPVAEGAAAGQGLDALFGGTGSAEDARTADVLAAAYLPVAPDTSPAPAEPAADPLRGRPARPAGNDLSLDHVFGAPRQAGTTRSSGSFSFDQFFAEGAVKPVREDAPEQPPNPGDEEDLEQFNSWLHNLRKQ